MKMSNVFYLGCIVILGWGFRPRNNEETRAVKKDEITKRSLPTKEFESTYFDSIYSIKVRSKSIVSKSQDSNGLKYPCVVSQNIEFAIKEKKVRTVNSPITEYVIDGNKRFLKYIIAEVGGVKIKGNSMYVIYLYASNGSPEYYYYFDRNGVLLFDQRCYRNDCHTTIRENKGIGPDESSKKVISMINVKGICIQ